MHVLTHKDLDFVIYSPRGTVDEKGLSDTNTIIILKKGTVLPIGSFAMSPFPGCCGIVVIHNLFVYREYRGSKYSDQIREAKPMIAKLFGYTLMIATTNHDKYATANMEKAGYTFVHEFRNTRTDNLIRIGIRNT